jgi:predicted porin
MKRILTTVLATALAGYFGCGAYAADDAASMGSGMVKAGSERIALSASANYDTNSGDKDTYDSNLTIAAEYGYMVCDQFQLAARIGFELDQTGTTTQTGTAQVRTQDYSLVIVPKWCIPVEGNIAPYVGPKVGAAYSSESGVGTSAEFIWGAVLGADIFLSKQTSLFVELDYTQFKLGSTDLGGGPITVKETGLAAGLAYWW